VCVNLSVIYYVRAILALGGNSTWIIVGGSESDL
jgi:hypothetical protein